MADYYVGSGERTLGAAAPLPWGFPRAALGVDSVNSGGFSSPRPAGFPLAVVGVLADGSAGVLFAKPVLLTQVEGAVGVLLARLAAVTAAEGAAGLLLTRTAIVTVAEGSAGSVIYRLWIVGEGERAAGIIAERPPVRHWLDGRGLYRIFNAAEYRFYRSRLGPPTGLAPFATSDSLPFAADETFSDGTWYLAVSYFSGVLDSGFLPLGPAGETYLQLNIVSGGAAGAPPAAPMDWRLEAAAGGIARVVGVYYEEGDNRAVEWSIAYTTDGSEPTADDPDLTDDVPASGLAVLSYELPAAADGATVKVRLQTRRNDGTEAEPIWVYSAGSTVLSIVADATGPSAPIAADRWAGPLPVEEG